MQNQKSPPELPNSWRTGHAPLTSLLIIARTVGPRPQVFLQGEGDVRYLVQPSHDGVHAAQEGAGLSGQLDQQRRHQQRRACPARATHAGVEQTIRSY